ncbi:putative endonuclease containing ERCC4 domain [Klebsormidium nitens]|uniref:Crossover junction endonuclease MUS81 n=1 Tax=Klebsormidium nitens TaxID=105231 RepID=A0A1Y1I5N7_KLENI|nr:putative endonuclease containing ERCC4 domain [Klebsormidium nitens]|eukprot:GAQ86265.1 putative endonuclease containing ERCC4 domain [Klebsormidium nitens]
MQQSPSATIPCQSQPRGNLQRLRDDSWGYPLFNRTWRSKSRQGLALQVWNKFVDSPRLHVGPFVLKKVGGHFAQGAEAGNGQGHGPEEGPPAKKRKTAPYVPKLNSAPYALLITMYRALAEGKDEYRRDELIQDADNSGLSEKTIALDPLNGQAGRRTTHTNQDYYSGWTSMSKQLIAKGLVLKQGNPPKYILTEYGEETARECLQRSNLADPLPAGPAGAAPRPTPAPGPRPPAGPPPPAAPKNARAAAAAAAEARMARNADAGGAGPSTAAAGGSRPDRRRDAVDTAGNRQQKGGAAGAGGAGAAGFRGLVAERPDLQRMGAEREPNEADGGHEEEGGTESDFEELDGWPAASPTDAVPVIGDDVVQKLVSLGFSPGQARTALHATHVADLPDSPLVEQAANWLLENDSTDRPAQPQSPVRPSFQARMATAEPREKRTGTVNGAAAPRAAVRERQGRPGSAAGGQGAARAPGRPPTAPTQRAAPARTAGQSGAGPSGTADRRDAGGPSKPAAPLAGGAVPLAVRVPPLAAGERFDARYMVVCLVDHREFLVRKLSSGDVLAAFAAHGLHADVRNLELGDFLWVAKERDGPGEYVLDYVCERKRVDDLSLSIQSSRYQRQKHFLDTCGLRRRIYLLEDDADKMDDHVRIKTACINTELVNGFDVQRTADSRDTLRRLVTLTAAIRDKLQHRTGEAPNSRKEPLPTFADFDRRAKASRRRTVKDLWGLMLTQVGGIGSDSANVIMQQYPTAGQLYEAYRKLDGKPQVMSQQLVAKFVRNAGGLKVGNKASENLFKFMFDPTPPEDSPEDDK